MNATTRWSLCLLLCVPLIAMAAAAQESKLDGQRDFDFSFGTWKTQLSRLVDPLSGSTQWVEYEGTSSVRKIWNGRANLVELDVKGPAGRIEGLSLRLYNPGSRQWSLNYASLTGGTMSEPMFGAFTDGRGEFFGVTTRNGRAILVKFVISKEAPDTWRFEQSFSDDGGTTWEKNWIAIDTLVDAKTEPPADETIRAFWSTLDATWKSRDAEAFSRLFSTDGSFHFVDRGQTLEGRAAIREFFARQFPTIAPGFRHRTTVGRIREISPQAHAVDGQVEILHETDGAEPSILRTFTIFGVMERTQEVWTIRDLRAYQLPADGRAP
jgi:uncharacterized protein (TIGR02246 family)